MNEKRGYRTMLRLATAGIIAIYAYVGRQILKEADYMEEQRRKAKEAQEAEELDQEN